MWSTWWQHRLTQAVLTLVGATVAAQVLTAAITPLLTRLYAPELFGVMAVFLAVATTVLTVSSGRYEMAIVAPAQAAEGHALWQLTQGINGVVAVCLALGVTVLGPALCHATGHDELIPVLWVMPLYVGLAGVFRANHYLALREQAYRGVGRAKMGQAVTAAGGQAGLGLTGWGTAGLLLGQTLGQGMGAWQLGRELGLRWPDYRACWPLSRAARDMAAKFSRFPRYDGPASLVDVLSVQLPNLLMAGFFGASVAGWYVLAERMVMLPVALVGQAVGQALFGFSREAKQGAGLDVLAGRAVIGLSALAFIPAWVLWWYGPPLFAWVFGPEWLEAGRYASWLMLGAAVQLVYAPISLLLMASEGQRLNLGIHSALLVGKAGALAYGVVWAQPLLAVQGVAWVSCMGYGLAILLVLRHLKAHQKASKSR